MSIAESVPAKKKSHGRWHHRSSHLRVSMLVKSAYHIDLAPSSRPYFAPVVGGIAASVSEMPFSQVVQFRPKVYLAGCRRAGWDLSAFAQGTIVSLYSSESPALSGPPTPPSTIASVPTSAAVASGQTGADFIVRTKPIVWLETTRYVTIIASTTGCSPCYALLTVKR